MVILNCKGKKSCYEETNRSCQTCHIQGENYVSFNLFKNLFCTKFQYLSNISKLIHHEAITARNKMKISAVYKCNH